MLLLSAATIYDSQLVSTSSRRTGKVCDTELGGSDFESDSPTEVTEYAYYDVDTSMTTLLVHAINRGNCKTDSYLTSDDHASFTTEGKTYGEDSRLT